MNEVDWITDRPPTKEEVGENARTMVTLLDGYVFAWTGCSIRRWWGRTETPPIAWLPRPAPYTPPEPEWPDWAEDEVHICKGEGRRWWTPGRKPDESYVTYRRADLVPKERTVKVARIATYVHIQYDAKERCKECAAALDGTEKYCRCGGRIERGES